MACFVGTCSSASLTMVRLPFRVAPEGPQARFLRPGGDGCAAGSLAEEVGVVSIGRAVVACHSRVWLTLGTLFAGLVVLGAWGGLGHCRVASL